MLDARTSQTLFVALLAITLGMTEVSGQGQKPRVDLLGDPLPAKALMRWGTQRFQHPDIANGLVLTPDQKVIATLNNEHLVAWGVDTGRKLWHKELDFEHKFRLTAAGYGLRPMAVLPRSGRLVTPVGVGRIALWDPKTGQSVEVPLEEPMATRSIDVSPDGKLLALGDKDRLAVCTLRGKFVYSKLNDTSAEIPLNSRDRLQFSGHFSYGRFSADGKLLALVNSESPKAIQLFKADTGKEVRTIETTDRVVRLEFSPDSRSIVATERDIAARLYEVETGKEVWTYQLEKDGRAECYTSGVTFRPDGNEIAVGAPLGPSNTIRLVDAKTGKETRVLTGSAWKPWTLAYTKDGKQLYGTGWDGVIRQWDLSNGEQRPRPGGVRAGSACAMSRRNGHMAFVDDTASVHLADVASGKSIREFKELGMSPETIVFSDDGKLLAAGGSNNKEVQIVVWDLTENKKIHDWKWNKGRDPHSGVEALDFSRNGKRIAAGVFRQSAAYVWDLPSDKQIAAVKHVEVYGLNLDPEGKTLMTAGWDSHIRVWECDTGKETKSLKAEPNGQRDDVRVWGVRLTSDQSTVVTIDMTQSVRIYDRALNFKRSIPDVALFRHASFDVSNNDQWVAVGGERSKQNGGRGVRVYEIATGELVWGVAAHDKSIYTVDFGPRSRTLLSGAGDGVSYLWDLQSENAMRGLPLSDVLESMMDADGQLAFQAYQHLATAPKAAAPLLIEKLRTAATQEISAKLARQLLIPVGSGREALWFRSKNRLLAAGPAAWDQLKARVDAGDLSERKESIVTELMETIELRYLRAALLLAELETPKVREAITGLIDNCASMKMKDLLTRALGYHDSLVGE